MVKVHLGHREGEWPLVIGVTNDPPAPLVVGQNWLGFQQAIELDCHGSGVRTQSCC